MKRSMLLMLSFFFFASFVVAQTKIDRFCEVTIEPKSGWAMKTIAIISFGSVDSLFAFKDTSELTKLKAVNKLTSAPDVLNYMSNIGWKIINISSVGNSVYIDKFYFKKEFDSNDIK